MTTENLPNRVVAALEYIEKMQCISEPLGLIRPGRELTTHEARVQHAALEVLRMYFLCEMDYSDSPPKDPDEESRAAAGGNAVCAAPPGPPPPPSQPE